MRVECEACRELVVASLRIDGDTVRATCPVCRSVMTAGAPSAGAPKDEPLCPKCGATRRDAALACASCGLAVARWTEYSDAHDAAVPEPVRKGWTRAMGAWNTAAAHDELLQLVAAHNCYAWAAGRYRTRGRDPVAQRQLDRLRRAAEATLLASATARRDTATKPYRAARSVLAILIVAVVVGAVYAMVVRNRPRAVTAAPVPAQPLTPGHPVSSSTVK